MAPPSQTKLERQVARAAEAALTARGFVTTIDVLVGIGWLSPPLVEDWGREHIPYLERTMGANLHKISTVIRCLRNWAEQQ